MPKPTKKDRKPQRPILSTLLLLSSTLFLIPDALAVPTATTDTYSTPTNRSITFNPMRNDRVGNAAYIFIRWAGQPESSRGTTTYRGNSITYTPPSNFRGPVRFWYSIQDSNGSKSGAHVRINVGSGDSSGGSGFPNAVDDNLTTRRGSPLTISPLVNDTGAGLRITTVNNYSTQGSRQRIIGSNQISYTPSSRASGADVFWYQVTDNQGRKNAAKVTVSVTGGNNSGAYPTAGSDNYTVNRNSTGTVFNVFQNDTGSGLAISQLSSYTQRGGRSFRNSGNTIRYDAPRNFVGTDQFWYSIRDSIGRTNSARVSITVRDTGSGGGSNGKPDAVEDSLRTTINAREFEIRVLANDTDPNGDTLRVQRVDPARSGSVRLVNNRVLYTPPSTTASDTFRYTVTDGRGGTDSTSVTVSVRDPNNPTRNPIVRNEFITMSAGQSAVIKVLDNDTDPDGDTLSLDQVTNGSKGTTTKVRDRNGKLNWVRYTAYGNASGTDVFYYGVPDGRGGNGSGKVTITFR